MRRMITTKQQEFVKELNDGLNVIGTYPETIEDQADITSQILSAEWLHENVDWGEHTIHSDTGVLYFEYPQWMEKYGFSDGGDTPYVILFFNDDIEFPGTIDTTEALIAWLIENIDSLPTVGIDDIIARNDVATYYEDAENEKFGLAVSNGKLTLSAPLKCVTGQGLPLVNGQLPNKAIESQGMSTNTLVVEGQANIGHIEKVNTNEIQSHTNPNTTDQEIVVYNSLRVVGHINANGYVAGKEVTWNYTMQESLAESNTMYKVTSTATLGVGQKGEFRLKACLDDGGYNVIADFVFTQASMVHDSIIESLSQRYPIQYMDANEDYHPGYLCVSGQLIKANRKPDLSAWLEDSNGNKLTLALGDDANPYDGTYGIRIDVLPH